MRQEYIDKFKEKQGFKNCTQIDDMVFAFDGFYFDKGDIMHDIDANVPAGKIKLYAAEGRDCGKVPDYPHWLANTFGL